MQRFFVLCLLGLINAAYISKENQKIPICEGATLVYDYKGPIPVEKLKTGDHVHIIASEITIGSGELGTFPQLLHVAIEKCSFKGEIEKFFRTMPSINRLVLENNHIENFKISDLTVLKNLEILSIKNQKLENLNAQSFVGLNDLVELHLISAAMDNIDEDTFQNSAKLEVLDLSGNKLKKLSRKMLEPLKNLKQLMLNNNYLEKLTAEQIPELPELEQIDAEGNQLSQVDLESITKKCPKLRTIRI